MSKRVEDIVEGVSFEELFESSDKVGSLLKLAPKDLRDFFGWLIASNNLEAFLGSAEDVVTERFILPLFSYWEKWLKTKERSMLDEICARHETESPLRRLPLGLETRFNKDELSLIFRNTYGVQLTFGCSGVCPKCMYDAVPQVRSVLPFSQLEYMFTEFAEDFKVSSPILYHASDPRDYKHGDKDYTHVHSLVQRVCGYEPHVTTKVSHNESSLEWLAALAKVAKDVRISIYHLKDHRKMERLLEAISERTDGVFQKTGQFGGFRVAGEHDVPIQDFMDDLDAYLKPYDPLYEELLGYEREPYEAGHLSGIGYGFVKEKKYNDQGDGIYLDPRGLYNVVSLGWVSEQFPQGVVVAPLIEIRDIKPESGMNIAEILPWCVVQLRHCSNDINAEAPLECVVHTKTGVFEIDFDKRGVVLEVRSI